MKILIIKAMSELHQSIINILTGRYKPMSRVELLRLLNVTCPELKDRQMRIEVKRINKLGLEAIGSDAEGYFIISDRQGLDRYKQTLKAKIFGLWQSFSDADKAYASKFGGKQTNIYEVIAEMEVERKVVEMGEVVSLG